MLFRLLSLFLVAGLLISSASANTYQGLKTAFDELNYALNVEWDQQDREFYNHEMQKFMVSVSKMQTQGLTYSDMVSFVKSEIPNEQLAKDVETAFSMITINKMEPAEATQYMLETMKRSYSTGANWSDTTKLIIISSAIVVGFALIIALSIKFSSESSDDTTVTPIGGCTQHYQCNQFCYNDAVWGYTCQPNCFWTCY